MGGAVVTSFLYQSRLAARVRGVILDAPGLNLDAAIDHGAGARRLPLLGAPIPAPLTTVAESIAGFRYHLDWDRLDYVRLVDYELPAALLTPVGSDKPVKPH